jgi:hypothetical protein
MVGYILAYCICIVIEKTCIFDQDSLDEFFGANEFCLCRTNCEDFRDRSYDVKSGILSNVPIRLSRRISSRHEYQSITICNCRLN